jgi:hypothetical protein
MAVAQHVLKAAADKVLDMQGRFVMGHPTEKAVLIRDWHALRAEVARLKDECDFMKVCGVIELMVRNPNIDSFVKEKEARIEQLEQNLAYCEDFGRCNCLKNYCDKGFKN